MNNTVKIILTVVIFLGCAVLGYFVMPSNKSKADGKLVGGNTGVVGVGGGGIGTTGTEPVPPTTGPDPDPDPDPDPEPVPAVETTPEIKSVVVEQRNSINYQKIGLACTVKATVISGDSLTYELYEIGGTTARYTSDNGQFREVYPVDGGKYLLRVVNAKTGDSAEQQVAGFNKIEKYTSSKLQAQLNVETTERLFYFHFDTDNLKFDCEGIDSFEIPTSLNALLSIRSANGWVYTVVGTPQYDKYNRITYFKVRITE